MLILHLVQGDQQPQGWLILFQGRRENMRKSNYCVYVLNQKGKPLMPTKRYGKVRRLLKDGLAKVVSRKPFTIQLLYETTQYTQPLVLGIDPGGKTIGLVVRKENGNIVYVAELESRRQEVSENMAERARNRRNRRAHHRKLIQRRAKKASTMFSK
jgi:activator of 2-hydroxyglutaryl-CoA dehydratase